MNRFREELIFYCLLGVVWVKEIRGLIRMLLLKNYNPRRSGQFQPRRRNYDAFSSSSESELSDNEPEYYSDLEEEKITTKSKIHEMNNAKLHRYFTPTKKKKQRTESLVSKKYGVEGCLESQRLDIKQIESRKKIDIIWNAIIAKYSAFDEENQGDVVNLEDFSIEEDTGHIKKLQNFQRTSIWNDINELEDQDYDEEEDWDPSEDPINLLTRKNGVISKKVWESKRISPIRRKKEPPVKTVDLTDDPIALLTPRKTTRVNTRVPSPTRFSKGSRIESDPIALLTPRKTTRVSTRIPSPTRSKPIDSDPIVMLTPRKTTRATSPIRTTMAPPSTPKRPTSVVEQSKPFQKPESRGRTMHRSSSPVRQLMATLPNLSTRTAHLPSPTQFNFKKSKADVQRHSSPVRRLLLQLSNKSNIDPINLLTPSSTTRQSSPLRKKARLTPKSTPKGLNDDPISLLTPRSSVKKPTRYKQHIMPPPKFQLSSKSLESIEENSSFIDPELKKISKEQVNYNDTFEFFKKKDLKRQNGEDNLQQDILKAGTMLI